MAKRIQENWRDRGTRYIVEQEPNKAIRWKQGKQDGAVPDWYNKIAGADTLIKLWGDVIYLRNSIAHCEMNQAEIYKPSTIRNNIQDMIFQIKALL